MDGTVKHVVSVRRVKYFVLIASMLGVLWCGIDFYFKCLADDNVGEIRANAKRSELLSRFRCVVERQIFLSPKTQTNSVVVMFGESADHSPVVYEYSVFGGRKFVLSYDPQTSRVLDAVNLYE